MIKQRAFNRNKSQPIQNNYMHMVHRTKEARQLWLGDYLAAKKLALLKQHNIRSVLTVAAMLNIEYPSQLQINHKIINAVDDHSYKMAQHFQEAFLFISDALDSGNILVHCAAGISRVCDIGIGVFVTCGTDELSVGLQLREKQKNCDKPKWWILKRVKKVLDNIGTKQYTCTEEDYDQSGDEEKLGQSIDVKQQGMEDI